MGKKTMMENVLSRANLNMFLPHGLEAWRVLTSLACCVMFKLTNISVATVSMLDSILDDGAYDPYGRSTNSVSITAQDRLAAYGDSLTPLTVIRPPLTGAGRQDPIAILGNAFAKRSQNKASRKAQKHAIKARKDADKGKTKVSKSDRLEGGMKLVGPPLACPSSHRCLR